jgi:hypothetical protein
LRSRPEPEPAPFRPPSRTRPGSRIVLEACFKGRRCPQRWLGKSFKALFIVRLRTASILSDFPLQAFRASGLFVHVRVEPHPVDLHGITANRYLQTSLWATSNLALVCGQQHWIGPKTQSQTHPPRQRGSAASHSTNTHCLPWHATSGSKTVAITRPIRAPFHAEIHTSGPRIHLAPRPWTLELVRPDISIRPLHPIAAEDRNKSESQGPIRIRVHLAAEPHPNKQEHPGSRPLPGRRALELRQLAAHESVKQ